MKKTITKEQLRQLIKEEMINEGMFSSLGKSLRSVGNWIESKNLNPTLVGIATILLGLTLPVAADPTIFKTDSAADTYLNNRIKDIKLNLTYNPQDLKNLSEASDEVLKDTFNTVLPVAFKTNTALLNTMVNLYNTKVRPILTGISRTINTNDLQTYSRSNSALTRTIDMEESKNNNNKITISELRQLVRSELRRHKSRY